MNIIEQINAEQATRELPEFSPGDTVIVSVKVREGDRERLQAFEGVVIAIKKRGLNSAFTVRKISHGTGVERVFQTHSPLIDSVKVKRRGSVVARSCTTCVISKARLPVSRKNWADQATAFVKSPHRGLFFTPKNHHSSLKDG